jgi:hypothetical protein
MKGKPRGRPFSGRDDPRRNKGGVPKEARELREALRAHGEEIVERFLELVRKGNVLATLKAVEHVVGRPEQTVSMLRVREVPRGSHPRIHEGRREPPEAHLEEKDGQAPATTAWDPNSRPSA